MPSPVPAAVLGRLAVEKLAEQRHCPFSDAKTGLRVTQAADTIGIRGIVVHALSDAARTFHLALGYKESPGPPDDSHSYDERAARVAHSVNAWVG